MYHLFFLREKFCWLIFFPLNRSYFPIFFYVLWLLFSKLDIWINNVVTLVIRLTSSLRVSFFFVVFSVYMFNCCSLSPCCRVAWGTNWRPSQVFSEPVIFSHHECWLSNFSYMNSCFPMSSSLMSGSTERNKEQYEGGEKDINPLKSLKVASAWVWMAYNNVWPPQHLYHWHQSRSQLSEYRSLMQDKVLIAHPDFLKVCASCSINTYMSACQGDWELGDQ